MTCCVPCLVSGYVFGGQSRGQAEGGGWEEDLNQTASGCGVCLRHTAAVSCIVCASHQVVQRVNPSTNGSVSPSILAKATSPLRTVASPPPSTSPATTTPLLRSGSGGSANREDMPNGPGAQPKAGTHTRRHDRDGIGMA